MSLAPPPHQPEDSSPLPQKDRAASLFSSLLDEHEISAAVSLEGSSQEAGGRRIVAARNVSSGEALLVVPSKILLTAHRSGVVGGLCGQTDLMWEAMGDLREEVGEELYNQGLTWDVRLALALFDATAGSGGDFWLSYRQLLPPPPLLTHPLCLPHKLLAELRDEPLQARVRSRSKLLQRLAPSLRAHTTHPATLSYSNMGAPLEMIPRPLEYAYALVVSRCHPTRALPVTTLPLTSARGLPQVFHNV